MSTLRPEDLRQRFCGLNADWSVDAWHYGPSERPNMNGGDLYVYEDECAQTFTLAVVHYNEWTGDTIITPIMSDYHTLEDAHNDALAMVTKRSEMEAK